MPYMIEVVIPIIVQRIVTNKYTCLYRQMKRKTGHVYPKTKLIENITNALSINGDYIDAQNIREPIVEDWKVKGYKVIPFHHWFYAIVLRQDKNGDTIAVAVDAKYEGDYHNNVMQTQPYNESIIIKESQLRRIIRESIKKVLNII